ncbi:unnamed protein product [Didymodactylos carnosus]|uniref:Uncharacterized protein n=1 Tax=Didymodactylos carnosus TaxID=1234261 RepID=A0A8S2E619_9BILA|nr:unnamed protein product [Didymodactylos carnosus]CAF3923175.1 unnamed protein product [Didymodactylos carnosus]
MTNVPYQNTRSKVNLKTLSISDLQSHSPPYKVKIPKSAAGKDSRRQSRIFSPLELRQSSSLSDTQLIFFDLSEEEEGEQDIMDAQQQQFEQDNREQLEELNKVFQETKRIEQEFLSKITCLQNVKESAAQIDQWFNSVEIIFRKLNYPEYCWAEEAIKHLNDENVKLWFEKEKDLINQQWDKFKQQLLKYVQGTEELIVAPLTNTAEQEEREYDTFIRKNFQKFSGKEGEDATTWLTDLVERFDKLKILESQWISYVPSVLSSKARVWYGKHKSSFTEFDDFSSKLSTDFDLKRDGPSSFRPSAPSSTISTERPPATDPVHFSLLKTLNEQVVKKLKTFSGRNQNVVTWLDELEIQFSAHGWGEEVRLKCVPTVLQDHALKCSKFSQQIAFERMINYQQGINQSVYDFYWGMLDISREIDPQPTAHNILQHLISNVKPSLKVKIMEKDPKTCGDPLENV